MKTKLLWLSLLFTGVGFAQTLELEEFATGFESPTEIVNAGDQRLFVVEQNGHIKVLNVDGTVQEADFLDISSLVAFTGEKGLLGLAFHPDYANNGYFYVNYVNSSNTTVIARYTRGTSAGVADPASALVMLTVEQPFDNHKGGCLRFGPDGYLYIGMGDGGSSGDPDNRAQNINVLLGKLLRLDVNAAAPYIPAGNPFVGIDGADEIWAYGLRNPWKFSFNKENNDLWIADVGQGEAEEINKALPAAANLNYGWKCYEGTLEYDLSQCTDPINYKSPVAQYLHDGSARCSITGGYVYTGEAYPNMLGKYFFADYCTGEIGAVDANNTLTWLGDFDGNFTTFGEDSDGELYIADGGGNVYKIKDTSVVGLDDFATSLFTLYPNPASNELYVGLKDASAGHASIYDISGQLVLEQPIAGAESKIDTSKLQTGVYVVSLETSGTKTNRKLIIN